MECKCAGIVASHPTNASPFTTIVWQDDALIHPTPFAYSSILSDRAPSHLGFEPCSRPDALSEDAAGQGILPEGAVHGALALGAACRRRARVAAHDRRPPPPPRAAGARVGPRPLALPRRVGRPDAVAEDATVDVTDEAAARWQPCHAWRAITARHHSKQANKATGGVSVKATDAEGGCKT